MTFHISYHLHNYIAKPKFVKKLNTCYAIYEKECWFYSQVAAFKHWKSHSKRKLHQCEHCHINTLRRGSTTFIRTHTKKKPLQCEFCEKVLQKNHVRIHTKEKPYQCEHCQTCFPWKDMKRRLAVFSQPLLHKNVAICFGPIRRHILIFHTKSSFSMYKWHVSTYTSYIITQRCIFFNQQDFVSDVKMGNSRFLELICYI